MLLQSALLTVATAVGAAFSPTYEVFAALRFFVGVGTAGTRNSAYIMGMLHTWYSVYILDML